MNKVRVGVAGCGNVSEWYLRDMAQSSFIELVSVCDAAPRRAAHRAEQFRVSHVYTDFDEMLTGARIDLLVNLTPMQRHFALNKKALEAGVNVLSEKPIATTREQGKELLDLAAAKGVQLFGAPDVALSPAFDCLYEVIHSGEIGAVVAAHGCYGHSGPEWGQWFYQSGGGSLFDLGVYNVTFLTNLLGPAKSVMAMMGTVIPERIVDGEKIQVETDDNAVVLLDHGASVFSCIQTGFTFADRESKTGGPLVTVDFIGTQGGAKLLGYDWGPHGVAVKSPKTNGWEVRCEDQQGYSWERCGSYAAEALATGKASPMAGERAYHVLEVMTAAQTSVREGRRIAVESNFTRPL